MSAGLEKAIRGAVWITAASMSLTVSGVVFWVAAAALAGKWGLGSTAYEVGAANTAAALLNLGLAQYTLRFVKSERGKALATALLASLLLGASAAAVLYKLGMQWAPLIALATLVGHVATGALIAVDAAKAYFVAAALASAAKVGLLAALPPAAAFASSTAIFATFAVGYAVRKVGLSKPSDWRTFLAAGVSNYMNNFSISLATSLGVVVVAATGNVEQAGLLYLVATATMALATISTAMATASVPVMVEKGVSLVEKGARIATALNTPIAVAAAGLSPTLMTLLGRQYAADYPALLAATPSVVLITAVALATARYNVEKRWASLAVLGLLSTISVATSTALLAGYGVTGPGLALSAGLLPPFLLYLRDLPKRPFLVSLAAVAVLGPLALYTGPAGTAAAILASVAVIHLSGIFKTHEYLALAKTVLGR